MIKIELPVMIKCEIGEQQRDSSNRCRAEICPYGNMTARAPALETEIYTICGTNGVRNAYLQFENPLEFVFGLLKKISAQ
ncbi:MAG: hypothetical protein AABY03_00290 [Nanoarchaeota archaeon]